MKRRYRGWLKGRGELSVLLSVLVVLIFVFGMVWNVLWANDQRMRASQEGANIGSTVQGALGSSSGINQRLFQPLLTPTPMVPLGGDTSRTFNATILCPSSKEFLKVSISPSSTGDLTLYINYDKGFVGSLNTSLVVSGVSAVCADGFMVCRAGTMSDCVSYAFYLDGKTLRYRQVVASSRHGLSGCFCVNNACGGSRILATNLGYVLRAVGGMVVSAFLNDPSARAYVVSDSKIEGMSITFYGQDSSQCRFVDQGTNAVQNLKDFYRNPGGLRSAGNVRLETQRGDPQSTVSLVYSASQMSSGDVKVCVIKRVASGCRVVERVEGDCDAASCRVMEETWDGIPIIQGGVRTKLNPLGSCVRDDCGNLRCYEWTTKRTVYACPREKVFNPALRVSTVYRSTTWDRGSGMVYYSDLTLESDCKSECPVGYTYNFVTLKCEALPFCPPGYRFEPSANACVAEDLSRCQQGQGGGTSQEICNNCPSGYVYDSSRRVCVADLICPTGGVLVYDGGRLRCEAERQGSANCPSGSSYDARLNICYTSISCPSGSSFNSSVGQCVAALSCPSGSSYDEAAKLCEAEEICPEGTAYNDETKKCEGEPQCQGGAIWDASIARCASCPSGYWYDSGSQSCRSSNGTAIVPTFSLPCSAGAIYNSETGLCEGAPTCPLGLNFDSNLNMCVAMPSCPFGFSFDTNVGACVASPKCPSGFTLDASRGICVAASSTFCPSGYVYDSGVGKCVFAISCPGGGYWDNVLRKCVKESFCVSQVVSNGNGACKIAPSCSGGGVWDQKLGKCVIETSCSGGGKWVRKDGQSFYLGSGAEGSDCEFACKVRVVEPKTEVYLKNTSTSYDLQYGTKTEKTGVNVSASYYYKPCVEVSAGTWSCPVEAGEEMVDSCKCVNNFGQAASIMQAIRLAGQDFVCSSGRRY
jgi:hypothetical protein